MGLRPPSELVDSVAGDPTPERRKWLARLPGTVQEPAQRWSLRLGQPYQPGGRSAWVAPVVDAAGRDLVLKVGWWHDEAAHEAEGLRAWAGGGAVRLHAAEVSGQTSALLLERCRPGTALAVLEPEPVQDVVIAELLRRLWITPPAGHPFRPLQEMCTAWASEFTERVEASPGSCDPGMARTAVEVIRLLPGTADRAVLAGLARRLVTHRATRAARSNDRGVRGVARPEAAAIRPPVERGGIARGCDVDGGETRWRPAAANTRPAASTTA
jgi:streptomycin 6-kinase